MRDRLLSGASARQAMKGRGAGAGLLSLAMLVLAAGGCARRTASPGMPGSANAAPQGTAEHMAAEGVVLKTEDGWAVAGDLYRPASKPKAAVILLHMRGGRAADWTPLSVALQKAGVLTLAIDQRGTGRSTQGPGSKGDDAPWETLGDVAAARRFLGTKLPLGVAGASYGANNALLYAARYKSQVGALALFSPGADYHGLKGLEAVRKTTCPIAIYWDPGDSISGKDPVHILAAAPSRNKRGVRLSADGKHGTDLLTPQTIPGVVDWFVTTLAAKNR